jgi:hypothetical protein
MVAAAPTPVTSPWTAFVRSDVYAGPVNEDGERPDELSYYVVCENERGERFASTVTFTTEEFWHGTAEPRAEAFCAKVTEALAAGADPTKSSRWYRIQGCYGSAAYSEKLELELDARDIEAESGHEEADRFRKATGIEHAVGAP